MTTAILTEHEFEKRADEELKRLIVALDDVDDFLEADLQMGVLTIAFPDGTRYVVNSHRAAKQIWMAADRSAWHFDRASDGRWIAAKTGDELFAALEGVLSKKLGAPIALPR